MKLFESGYHKPTAPLDLMARVDQMAVIMRDWIEANGSNVSHIVCTGVSGQSIAWPLSYKLNIPVVVVRKDNEKAHSGTIVGQGELGRYVILDDFIAGGSTVRRIIDEIDKQHRGQKEQDWLETPTRPECVAIFLYDRRRERDFAVTPDHVIPVIGNPNGAF
jgi:hypothetical protein